MTDTEQLIAVLANEPMLVMEFLAEVGGDPEEYGIADVASPTSAQTGNALREFLQLPGDFVPAPIAALARSQGVDWAAVVEHLDDILTSDAFGA